MEVYDVIIVGGASAGLTAAIYAARRKLNTLVITKGIGGQELETNNIENYPGFLRISGVELANRIFEQAVKSGAQIILDEVVKVEDTDEKINDKPVYAVKTASGKTYKAKAVILAFGKTPRNLDVPGEKEFVGKGVSYCATCDAPLFKNRVVAVVGGGNSAFEAAHILSQIAKKVYLIHRREQFRAFEYLVERVRKLENVEFVLNTVVKEIKGDMAVKSILVENVQTGETKEIQVDGVFIEIGSYVKTDIVEGFVKIAKNNYIPVDKLCRAYKPDSDEIKPGVFAAGDVTDIPFKQLVVSAGQGCVAALQAYNYLHDLGESIFADWSKSV